MPRAQPIAKHSTASAPALSHTLQAEPELPSHTTPNPFSPTHSAASALSAPLHEAAGLAKGGAPLESAGGSPSNPFAPQAVTSNPFASLSKADPRAVTQITQPLPNLKQQASQITAVTNKARKNPRKAAVDSSSSSSPEVTEVTEATDDNEDSASEGTNDGDGSSTLLSPLPTTGADVLQGSTVTSAPFTPPYTSPHTDPNSRNTDSVAVTAVSVDSGATAVDPGAAAEGRGSGWRDRFSEVQQEAAKSPNSRGIGRVRARAASLSPYHSPDDAVKGICIVCNTPVTSGQKRTQSELGYSHYECDERATAGRSLRPSGRESSPGLAERSGRLHRNPPAAAADESSRSPSHGRGSGWRDRFADASKTAALNDASAAAAQAFARDTPHHTDEASVSSFSSSTPRSLSNSRGSGWRDRFAEASRIASLNEDGTRSLADARREVDNVRKRAATPAGQSRLGGASPQVERSQVQAVEAAERTTVEEALEEAFTQELFLQALEERTLKGESSADCVQLAEAQGRVVELEGRLSSTEQQLAEAQSRESELEGRLQKVLQQEVFSHSEDEQAMQMALAIAQKECSMLGDGLADALASLNASHAKCDRVVAHSTLKNKLLLEVAFEAFESLDTWNQQLMHRIADEKEQLAHWMHTATDSVSAEEEHTADWENVRKLGSLREEYQRMQQHVQGLDSDLLTTQSCDAKAELEELGANWMKRLTSSRDQNVHLQRQLQIARDTRMDAVAIAFEDVKLLAESAAPMLVASPVSLPSLAEQLETVVGETMQLQGTVIELQGTEEQLRGTVMQLQCTVTELQGTNTEQAKDLKSVRSQLVAQVAHEMKQALEAVETHRQAIEHEHAAVVHSLECEIESSKEDNARLLASLVQAQSKHLAHEAGPVDAGGSGADVDRLDVDDSGALDADEEQDDLFSSSSNWGETSNKLPDCECFVADHEVLQGAELAAAHGLTVELQSELAVTQNKLAAAVANGQAAEQEHAESARLLQLHLEAARAECETKERSRMQVRLALSSYQKAVERMSELPLWDFECEGDTDAPSVGCEGDADAPSVGCEGDADAPSVGCEVEVESQKGESSADGVQLAEAQSRVAELEGRLSSTEQQLAEAAAQVEAAKQAHADEAQASKRVFEETIVVRQQANVDLELKLNTMTIKMQMAQEQHAEAVQLLKGKASSRLAQNANLKGAVTKLKNGVLKYRSENAKLKERARAHETSMQEAASKERANSAAAHSRMVELQSELAVTQNKLAAAVANGQAAEQEHAESARLLQLHLEAARAEHCKLQAQAARHEAVSSHQEASLHQTQQELAKAVTSGMLKGAASLKHQVEAEELAETVQQEHLERMTSLECGAATATAELLKLQDTVAWLESGRIELDAELEDALTELVVLRQTAYEQAAYQVKLQACVAELESELVMVRSELTAAVVECRTNEQKHVEIVVMMQCDVEAITAEREKLENTVMWLESAVEKSDSACAGRKATLHHALSEMESLRCAAAKGEAAAAASCSQVAQLEGRLAAAVSKEQQVEKGHAALVASLEFELEMDKAEKSRLVLELAKSNKRIFELEIGHNYTGVLQRTRSTKPSLCNASISDINLECSPLFSPKKQS